MQLWATRQTMRQVVAAQRLLPPLRSMLELMQLWAMLQTLRQELAAQRPLPPLRSMSQWLLPLRAALQLRSAQLWAMLQTIQWTMPQTMGGRRQLAATLPATALPLPPLPSSTA
jgi:hypothetical protein